MYNTLILKFPTYDSLRSDGSHISWRFMLFLINDIYIYLSLLQLQLWVHPVTHFLTSTFLKVSLITGGILTIIQSTMRSWWSEENSPRTSRCWTQLSGIRNLLTVLLQWQFFMKREGD